MARKYHRIISTLAVGGLLAAFAPGAYAASATELGTKYETLDESLWSCVWNDEFDGSSVDTTKWSYTVGGGGFGNNEQQYYTDSASNSYIQDGCLVIEALQESNGDENYTSPQSCCFLWGTFREQQILPMTFILMTLPWRPCRMSW